MEEKDEEAHRRAEHHRKKDRQAFSQINSAKRPTRAVAGDFRPDEHKQEKKEGYICPVSSPPAPALGIPGHSGHGKEAYRGDFFY